MEEDSQDPRALQDWLILDALSDDYESVEQIVAMVRDEWPDVTPLEVIDHLQRLHDDGHVFLTLDAQFDREEMIREIDDVSSRRFWFGRTETGDLLWQAGADPLGRE